MARNRKKPAVAVWITWTPDWADVFSLVPSSYRPPHQVRLHRGKRHATAVARFTTPDGYISTAKARLVRDGDGVAVTDQSLDQRFSFAAGELTNPEA